MGAYWKTITEKGCIFTLGGCIFCPQENDYFSQNAPKCEIKAYFSPKILHKKTIKAWKQRSFQAFWQWKCTLILYQNKGAGMVEATRIELVSENKSTQLSTSVVYLHWFPFKAAGKQAAENGSSNPILRCEQAAGTFTTAMMPQRRPWYFCGRQ